MMHGALGFERTASVGSVTELRGQFPHLPPRILVTLAVMTFLARTVTPFRLCACGCGESVHCKARLASPACRQRVSREARAVRATAPKQFNLVLQHEIPVTIPFSPAPRDHGSAPLTLAEVWNAPDECDKAETVELSERTEIAPCATATAGIFARANCAAILDVLRSYGQPHEPATRARAFRLTTFDHIWLGHRFSCDSYIGSVSKTS